VRIGVTGKENKSENKIGYSRSLKSCLVIIRTFRELNLFMCTYSSRIESFETELKKSQSKVIKNICRNLRTVFCFLVILAGTDIFLPSL